ncbi:cytochrome c oxidase assembly protein COX11, mitochondrial [Galendromus occidentalis]|uniref:Cytochrome c oxidase assembly protein COX11, mitochondrial n=1 Tax=Galendromus occidentalis TaxID=34638 RepID=A0AAJ6QNY6_9ACAR|nr:cytochrome c oxidase assembly protein COX11, mitochondrial [Galendromus occidentalis]
MCLRALGRLSTQCLLKHPKVLITKRISRTISDKRAVIGNRTAVYYTTSLVLVVGGLSYAAVPLYRIYCQAAGTGGQAAFLGPSTEDAGSKVETMTAVKHRTITVSFQADTASGMRWNFKPQQSSVRLRPGETVLAFYSAKNPFDKPVDGIATYNVMPFEAGKYFNKIQCFCFEEQRLNPGEEVDMPVFFYIDPEYAEDPKMENVDQITLSYTFFESKPGLNLPVPTIR